jgi:hypothetical protein
MDRCHRDPAARSAAHGWRLDADSMACLRCRRGAAEPEAAAPRRAQQGAAQVVQVGPAADVRHREGRYRRRHGLVGRGAVQRPTELERAAAHAARRAQPGRARISRRARGRAMPHARRLEDQPGTRRPAARGLELPGQAPLLWHDHPEGIRRARLLGARTVRGGPEGRQPQRRGRGHGDGAKLARPRRAADALRDRGTEEAFPAAARQG